VSHELAIAVVSSIGSFTNGFQFAKTCLSSPTIRCGEHWINSVGLRSPSWIAASAVTGLNVEPGG
jgi:hypothetical protein